MSQIKRYRVVGGFQIEHDFGSLCLFSDHEQAIDARDQRIAALESLCIEAAIELTKTLPANHPLRVKLEAAGDGQVGQEPKEQTR